jgi:hypothetical protein
MCELSHRLAGIRRSAPDSDIGTRARAASIAISSFLSLSVLVSEQYAGRKFYSLWSQVEEGAEENIFDLRDTGGNRKFGNNS